MKRLFHKIVFRISIDRISLSIALQPAPFHRCYRYYFKAPYSKDIFNGKGFKTDLIYQSYNTFWHKMTHMGRRAIKPINQYINQSKLI